MIQPLCSSNKRTFWDCVDTVALNHMMSLSHLLQYERLLKEGDEIYAYSFVDKSRAHLLVVGTKPLAVERIDRRPAGRPAKEAA